MVLSSFELLLIYYIRFICRHLFISISFFIRHLKSQSEVKTIFQILLPRIIYTIREIEENKTLREGEKKKYFIFLKRLWRASKKLYRLCVFIFNYSYYPMCYI